MQNDVARRLKLDGPSTIGVELAGACSLRGGRICPTNLTPADVPCQDPNEHHGQSRICELDEDVAASPPGCAAVEERLTIRGEDETNGDLEVLLNGLVGNVAGVEAFAVALWPRLVEHSLVEFGAFGRVSGVEVAVGVPGRWVHAGIVVSGYDKRPALTRRAGRLCVT